MTPTHFIQQYAPKDEYKVGNRNKFYHSDYYSIQELPFYLKMINETKALHTVAVFKIQFKNNDKNNS